jgi:hypothetical protein
MRVGHRAMTYKCFPPAYRAFFQIWSNIKAVSLDRVWSFSSIGGERMAITHQTDPERNFVTLIAEGIITDEDLASCRADLVKNSLFRPGMKILADFRAAERFSLSMKGVFQRVESDRSLEPELKNSRQAVVTSSDLLFGMARVYQARMSEVFDKIEIFRDMDAAKAWLFEETEREEAES